MLDFRHQLCKVSSGVQMDMANPPIALKVLDWIDKFYHKGYQDFHVRGKKKACFHFYLLLGHF